MRKRILLIALALFALGCMAQGTKNWEEYLNELSDTEDMDNVSWEQYHDILAEYAEQPMNINTATREDLERLPFLGNQQIEDIQAYIYQYGKMESLGELAMIRSLNWYQRKLLECFTYAGSVPQRSYPTLKNILRHGKHEVVAAAKIPFYNRKGDIEGYRGYKYKHWWRYKFHYGDYAQAGLLGSQDAGEPFFSNANNLGYDFYSFYFQVRKLGALKNLTLGRYRLRFGMGLVINNDFGLGKTNTLTTLGRNGNAIRVHSSRSSGNFLQGGAATVTPLKGLDLTAFFSYRKIDATLNSDGQSIATILTDGYHRTDTELAKKANSSQTLAGANLNYTLGGFHMGMTGLYTKFDKPLLPKKTSLYRKYYPEGNGFWNVSADYGYASHRLSFSGETATGDCKALATVNTLSYLLTEELSLVALQRFFSYKYYSLFSNTFSEGSDAQDESGIYLGASWTPSSKFNLMGYADIAYFPWAKYMASAASHAFDSMVSATYHPGDFSFFFRYRYKMKERDNADKTALEYRKEHRARLSAAYAGMRFTAKTQYDASLSQFDGNSFGWMATQQMGYTYRWLRVDGTFGYFHTADYASRVYTYEAGTLYTLNFTSFYGEGIRYAARLRAELGEHWLIIAKLGITDYFDRDHISSGYQQINQSSQTDLDIQVRWKF